VSVLEILSPTNKGHYSRLDIEHFSERRHRLLASDASYIEVDAVASGVRWLPRCPESLRPNSGVVWTSKPDASGRAFRGWAWRSEGPLPSVPWDLGEHGSLTVDLDSTLLEPTRAAGISS